MNENNSCDRGEQNKDDLSGSSPGPFSSQWNNNASNNSETSRTQDSAESSMDMNRGNAPEYGHPYPPNFNNMNGCRASVPPFAFEKQSLKRTVRRVAASMIILQVSETILAYLISLIINIVLYDKIQLAYLGMITYPDGTYYGMDAGLYDFLTSYLPVIAGDCLVILYLFLSTRIPFKKLFSKPIIPSVCTAESGNTRKPISPWVWILFASAAGLGISMIGQICAIFELEFFYTIGFPFYSPSFSTDGYTLLDTVAINLYICIIGPVLEEVIFRGFILRACQKHGVSFAALFTAILFTLFHLNLVQLFVPLLMGIFLAVLTIKTDSLIPSICCHILNNTVSTILSYVTPDNVVWSWVVLIVECAVCIGILAIFWIYYGKHFSAILKWRHPVLSLSRQIGAAISTWPSIVFIAYYIIAVALSSLSTVIG